MSTNSYEIFWRMGRLNNNKPFDFRADPNTIRIQDFLNELLPLRDRGHF